MKNFFFLLCAITSFTLSAQKADEVINKYITTIGGAEKLSAIKGLKMEMVSNYQGMEIPVDVTSTKDGKMLVKVNFMGKEMTQVAFDGTNGWSTNMMTMKPEKMDSETIENMKKSSGKDFPDPFLNYKANGYTADYIAEETKEGTKCHKIKLTKEPQTINGEKVEDVTFYYFSVDDAILVTSESPIQEGPMKGQMATSSVSNYQEVNGIYFPFTMNQFGQEMTIKKITIDPTINLADFEFKAE